jgi:AraC-like DNA-binding protein
MPAAAAPVPAPTRAAAGARVTGAYLQPLLEAAGARGIRPQALACAIGRDADALDPLPASIPAHDYVALLAAGAVLCADPHFGLHVGECVRLGSYSAYGLALLACGDIGQALAHTQRYEALAHDLGRSQMELEHGSGAGAAHYTWTSHYPQASRHLIESVFAGIRVFGSWLAGRPLAPARVAFAHARAADTDPQEYLRVLGVAPQFGAERHLAVLDGAVLALPLPNADLQLYPVLRQHAERLLRERHRSCAGVVTDLRAAIVHGLARDRVRLPQVAAVLGLSARSLQRKLADAGTSFQAVLDETRYQLSLDYLRQDTLALADIAFLLGFHEQSAFTHAFRDWSGMNPGAWREQEKQRARAAAAGA